MEGKKNMIAIVGPTASGKTALAVALSRKLGGEVVSCDSMQVYCGMDIGTAKPTVAEREGVPHHLLDVAPPTAPFSCADYVDLAARATEDVLSRGRIPVFCGGTGLYLDRFLQGGVQEDAGCDAAVRQRLWDEVERLGKHALHARLAQVDPESAAAIHENNVKRVVRALEIYEITGVPKSESDRCTKTASSPYAALVIGLRFTDRALLYRRIEQRVDEMLAQGLLEETERLLRAGAFEINSTAAQAIGYKEMLAYLNGEEPYACAVERLKTATRRYAKRQMTWFSAKEYVHWLDADRDGAPLSREELLDASLNIIEPFLRS